MYFSIKISYLFSLFSTTTLAQSWNRRAYFDDTRCAGALSVGISLPDRHACAQTSAFNCEVKGQDPYKTANLKSSEASGICTPRSAEISDAPWTPTSGEGSLRPGASYMTVNIYSNNDVCSPAALYEQDMFLADGRCYAVEFEKSFFRATCNGNVGTLSVFNDPGCQDCSNANLFAGMYQVRSISGDESCVNNPNRGISYKIICSVPGGGSTGTSPAPGVDCPAYTPTADTATSESLAAATAGGTNNAGPGIPSTGTAGSNGNSNSNTNSDQQNVANVVGMAGLAAALMI
jgi:hypothetical protein